MKQIRFIAAIAAAAALLAACAKEMDAPQGRSVSQITASLAESQTKTVLGEDGTSVLWSPKDAISVFYNGDGLKFTSINQSPKATTMFVSSGTVVIGSTEDYGSTPYLYGIYPYSSNNAQEDEYLTLTVPAFQTAVEGSFGRGAYPSIARSKTTDLAFYNVCGGIRFSVTTSGVQKVVFSGMSDENLAGKMKVVFGQDGKPVITTVSEGDKELTFCTEKEFTPGKYYYISAIPTALKNGFKMVFYTATKHATLTVSSAVEIKRSTFGSLKDADSGLVYEDGGSISSLVDLGLSVKWASFNVGATKPEEYGTYFAWGDVTGQTWNGSSWSGGGFSSYPSYELDGNGNLKPEYDAAHVNLGSNWRMPTKAEQLELISNCTSTWTSDYNGTGVAGRIFTSNKEGYTDKSIFLPAAGYGGSSYLYAAGSAGQYWSSTFNLGDGDAWELSFESCGVGTYCFSRFGGRSVRPVTE